MIAPVFAHIFALSVAQLPTPVVPGESLGPIKLGMTEAQLAATKIAIKPGRFETERRVGVFDVQIKDGKVASISYELGKDGQPILLGGKAFTPTTPQAIAAAATQCGPLDMRIGGNIIECAPGLVIGQHMGGLAITVQPAATRSEAPVCAGYLEPGNPKSALELTPGVPYCLPSRVVTTATVEADVLGKLSYNTCRTERNIGATVVTCAYQGTRFVFAGPTGALHRVEGVPFKTE